MAFDDRYEREAAKPPVSLHPAFPAVVALWFAALLGLGSLVLPAVLLERLVVATGVASFVPAAGPPLGMTARAVIAIIGALVGAGLGVALARRVARAHSPEPVSRVAKLAGGSRRPLSVKDELGGTEGLRGVVNGESLPISRRRALAISEDDRPSDFLYRAPLPGDDSDAPAPFTAAPVVEATPDDEPLELSELAEAGAAFAESDDEADPVETHGDFEMTDSREFKSSWPTEQHYPREAQPVDERDARNNLAGPRGLEPLPFAAPSLARQAKVEFAPEPEAESGPEPDVRLEAVASAAAPVDEAPALRADWQTAPLDGLGLVQLVQRLGSTIERRHALMAQAAAAPAAVPVSFSQPDFEPAPAEEAVQAMAAFFAPGPAETAEPEPDPPAVPAEASFAPAPAPRPDFLRPITVAEEDDGEDAVPDFSLPLRRRPDAAAPSFSLADNDAEDSGEADELDDAEAADESGYSSLLGMRNPFAAPKNEFVRIEEPEADADMAEPAVVFPGQADPARSAEPAAAPASRLFDPPGKPVLSKAEGTAAPGAAAPQTAPADADAALRAALATLQRMSGAA